MTTILIVDDDVNITYILAGQLRALGEVRSAHNIADALIEMRKLPPPDLVFLDLFFKEHGAEETLSHIAKFKEINPNAVIIVITGSSEARLEQMALEMGADKFTQKNQIATSARLYKACRGAFIDKGASGQEMLDRLNLLLTPPPK